MKKLQNLIITATGYTGYYKQKGDMVNKYAPFKNLVRDNGLIDSFKTKELKLDINSPINIEIQPSFDGSVNLILNDNVTNPKLINSKFSVEESNTYSIIDHEGNKDTNLYLESQLDLDTKLYKNINKIPILVFKGLGTSGKMKCGSYHFYFKLSDNDGNETDFISESGLVTCHIGNINDPYSIRMGMIDEDSKKSVSFELSNLDTSYDFVKVYYTRTTSDDTQQDIITANYIDIQYPINKGISDIVITGFESQIDIPLVDINPLYELVSSAKTQTQCQNMLFLANINKPTIPYTELKDLSLRFIPSLINQISVGNLRDNYLDYSSGENYEYYNTKNIYYNLGY